jgi:hypothetical protein
VQGTREHKVAFCFRLHYKWTRREKIRKRRQLQLNIHCSIDHKAGKSSHVHAAL